MAKNELQVSDFESKGLGIALTTSSMSKEDYKEIEEYCNKHGIRASSVPAELKNEYFDNIVKLSSFFATHTNGFDIVMKKCSDMGMLAKCGETQELKASEAQQLFISLVKVLSHDESENTPPTALRALREIASGERVATTTEFFIVHEEGAEDKGDGDDDGYDFDLQDKIACLEDEIERINNELEPLLCKDRGYTTEDSLEVLIYLTGSTSRISKRVRAHALVESLGYSPSLLRGGEILPRVNQVYVDVIFMLVRDAKRLKEPVIAEILQELLISCLNDENVIRSMAIEF